MPKLKEIYKQLTNFPPISKKTLGQIKDDATELALNYGPMGLTIKTHLAKGWDPKAFKAFTDELNNHNTNVKDLWRKYGLEKLKTMYGETATVGEIPDIHSSANLANLGKLPVIPSAKEALLNDITTDPSIIKALLDSYGIKQSEILHHQLLYKNYPSLADIPVVKFKGLGGYYSPKGNFIGLGSQNPYADVLPFTIKNTFDRNDPIKALPKDYLANLERKLRSVMLHENTHIIARKSALPKAFYGSNSKYEEAMNLWSNQANGPGQREKWLRERLNQIYQSPENFGLDKYNLHGGAISRRIAELSSKNPNTRAFEMYQSNAGEALARMVQNRLRDKVSTQNAISRQPFSYTLEQMGYPLEATPWY